MKYQAIKTMYKCQRGPRVTRTPILGLSNHIPALKWIIFILGNKSLCKEDYLSNCEHSWLWTQPNKSKHVKFENFLYQSSLKKKSFHRDWYFDIYFNLADLFMSNITGRHVLFILLYLIWVFPDFICEDTCLGRSLFTSLLPGEAKGEKSGLTGCSTGIRIWWKYLRRNYPQRTTATGRRKRREDYYW